AYYIRSRYPDDPGMSRLKLERKKATNLLKTTEEFMKWLPSKPE
ncbi:MAG: HEPN domain-containing protein, partial [Candidatus Hydrogenedentes bacterium]|nr:HEPN domain-containing protein [Candidatus Hydrogenedentota bacterium]